MGEIVFENVSKKYGEKQVLNNFSHTFRDGCATAVMGASGAGKTTLVRLMMGLERADSGLISGIENERFGCVFQEDRLIESANAVENIALVFGKVSIDAILKELAEVGLGSGNLEDEDIELLSKPVSEFSGGMKRRVAIVRALMSECDTVVLDEPFKGLDDELKEKVMGYVEDRLGMRRLILVTHVRSEAEALCGEIIEL